MPTQHLQLLNVLLTEVPVLLVLRWRHKSPELVGVFECLLVHLQLLVALHPKQDGTQLDLSQLHLVLHALAWADSLVIGVEGLVVRNQSQDVRVDLSGFLKRRSFINAIFAVFDQLAGLILKLIEFTVVTDRLRLLG